MIDILVLRNLVYVKKYCITDYYTFLTLVAVYMYIWNTYTHEHSVLSNTETVSRLKSKTKPMGFICY